MSNPSVNQAINRYEQIACRFTLILVVSKPRHAHSDAQLERSLVGSSEPRIRNPAAPGNRGGGELRGLLKSTSTTLSFRPITYRCVVASCMANSTCSASPGYVTALEIPSCRHHRVDGKRDCGAERVGIFHRSPVYPNSSAPPLCRRIELMDRVGERAVQARPQWRKHPMPRMPRSRASRLTSNPDH